MRNIDKKYHYLYKTTNILNNMYYYGIHSTNNLNDNYLGSGKHLTHSIRKYGKDNFKKEILEYFNTRDELALADNLLITKDMLIDKQCMNILFGGEYYNTIGMVSVKDKNGNYFKVFNDDSRYLSGELVGCTTGKANVKDKDGNFHQVDKNDIRILSGEFEHILKGKVSVKDKDGNTYQVEKTDPRYLSGELVPIAKNTVTVKDKDGNNYQVDKNDPKYLSGELTYNLKGLISVKDKDGNIFSVDKNDSRFLSGELVGRAKGLKISNETKEKLSIALKGKYNWINKDGQKKFIKKEELHNYLTLGWNKGIGSKSKKS